MSGRPSVKVTLTALTSGISPAVRRLALDPEQPIISVGRASKSLTKGLLGAEHNAWFDSPVMSRNHAEITLDSANNTVTLTDIGSMHGTFLNNHQLQPHQPEAFQPGDNVVFGAEVSRGLETFPACGFTIEYESVKVNSTSSNTYSCPDSSDVEDEIDAIHDEMDMKSSQSDDDDDDCDILAPPKTSVSIQSIDLTVDDSEAMSENSHVEDNDDSCDDDGDTDMGTHLRRVFDLTREVEPTTDKSPIVIVSDSEPTTTAKLPIVLFSDSDSTGDSAEELSCSSDYSEDEEFVSHSSDEEQDQDQDQDQDQEINEGQGHEVDEEQDHELDTDRGQVLEQNQDQDQDLEQDEGHLSEPENITEVGDVDAVKAAQDSITTGDSQRSPFSRETPEAPMQSGLRELLEASESVLDGENDDDACLRNSDIESFFGDRPLDVEYSTYGSNDKTSPELQKRREYWSKVYQSPFARSSLHDKAQSSSVDAVPNKLQESPIPARELNLNMAAGSPVIPARVFNNNIKSSTKTCQAQDYNSRFVSYTEMDYPSAFSQFSVQSQGKSIHRRPSPSDAAMVKSAAQSDDTPDNGFVITTSHNLPRQDWNRVTGQSLGERAGKRAFFEARESNRAKLAKMASLSTYESDASSTWDQGLNPPSYPAPPKGLWRTRYQKQKLEPSARCIDFSITHAKPVSGLFDSLPANNMHMGVDNTVQNSSTSSFVSKPSSFSHAPRSKVSIHDIIEESSTEPKPHSLKRKADEISNVVEEELQGWASFRGLNETVTTNTSDDTNAGIVQAVSNDNDIKTSPDIANSSHKSIPVKELAVAVSNVPAEIIHVGEPDTVIQRPNKRLRRFVEKASYVVLGGAGLFSLLVVTAPDFL